MLHITSLDDGLDIFKALGSDVRIEIIKLLIENQEMNTTINTAKTATKIIARYFIINQSP